MIWWMEVGVGEILRNKQTRDIWIIVHKNKTGLFIVSLMLNQDPADVMMMLPSNMDNWQRDIEIDDLEKWEKDIIIGKMPIIESIEKVMQDDK